MGGKSKKLIYVPNSAVLGFLARDRRQVGRSKRLPLETPQILAHNDDKRKQIMFSAGLRETEKGFLLLQLCDPGWPEER